MRDPKSLTPHPLLARITTLPEMAELYYKRAKDGGKARQEHLEKAEEVREEFAALVESIKLHGVREPLRVSGNFIVDGRHRWLAALEAGVMVPVREVDAAEIPDVIQDAVTRRHFSKGALAYMTVILHPEIADSKKGNPQLQDSKNIDKSQMTTELSIGEWAAKIAVTRQLLTQAVELYRLVSRYKSQQLVTDAAVWAGKGLGGILAGLKGNKEALDAGKDLPPDALIEKRVIEYDKLAVRTATTVLTIAQNWGKIPEEWQQHTLEKWGEALALLPPVTRANLFDQASEKQTNNG